MTAIQKETVGWIAYEEQANEALETLKRMKKDAEAYAKKSNANQAYVQARLKHIAVLYRALRTADELLKLAEENRKAHYHEGYRKGMEAGQLSDDERSYREYRLRTKLKIR